MANVGLIFGGRSVEHQVSVNSARTVSQALRDAGHAVTPLGIAPDGCWIAPDDAGPALRGEVDDLPPVGERVAPTLRHLIASEVDVLFPLVHGTWGEDGTLQGLCEMLDLPYVGAGVTASALAMDKAFSKQVFAAAGLPVLDYETITGQSFQHDPEAELARLERFTPPIFVKPAIGGSSVGITKVDRTAGLRDAIAHALRFDDRVVVERGVAGRELECAVLGYRDLRASAVGEIVAGKEFYDYADKYVDDGARLIAPAELPEALAERLRKLAVAAFAAVEGWGMARVDFLLEGDDQTYLYLNEINSIPGFTAISMYPRLWGLSGVPLPELVDRLVRIAQERHADRRRLDAGIKGWIASLAAS